MLRVAVLASGRGSNLAALLQAEQRASWRVLGVYSDRPNCDALALARQAGRDAIGLRPRDFADRAGFDRALFQAIAPIQPDLIVCAGYMRIITAEALADLRTPMINIHPSLLPRHRGLDTHARALQAGDAEHGCSVHGVIAELDAGPVLAQARLAIAADDTPARLSERVLALEHQVLPACISEIASGRLRLSGNQAHYAGQPLRAPLQWQHGRLCLEPSA